MNPLHQQAIDLLTKGHVDEALELLGSPYRQPPRDQQIPQLPPRIDDRDYWETRLWDTNTVEALLRLLEKRAKTVYKYVARRYKVSREVAEEMVKDQLWYAPKGDYSDEVILEEVRSALPYNPRLAK